MPKLLRNRWLQRTLLASALLALGVGIYRVQEPAPMCEIEAATLHRGWLTADGGRLIAASRTLFDEEVIENGVARIEKRTTFFRARRGPFRVWDTRTGAEIARHFTEEDHVWVRAFSADRRWLAAEVTQEDGDEWPNRQALVLVNFATGKSRELPFADTDRRPSVYFSPSNEILVRFRSDPGILSIYETASGRLLAERAADGVAEPPFAGDELCYFVTTKTNQHNVVVWSARERKTVAILEGFNHRVRRDANGPYWFASREANGETTGGGIVWNSQTHAIEAEIPAEQDLPRWFRNISADGRWLVFEKDGEAKNYLEVRDVKTGRAVGRTPVGVFKDRFSPDGRFLVIHDTKDATTRLRMFEPATMNTLWERPMTASFDNVFFSRDSRTVLIVSNETSDVCGYDCATGALRDRLAFPVAFAKTVVRMQVTPDSGSLLVEHWKGTPLNETWIDKSPWLSRLLRRDRNDTTALLDTDSGQQLFRLDGWEVGWADLSDDGGTLATMHEERYTGQPVLRCWNVNAWKPLSWPIGVPAGLAAVIVLFAWWRGRRRTLARNAAPGSGPPPDLR